MLYKVMLTNVSVSKRKNYEFLEIRRGFFDKIYRSKLNESVCDGSKTWHAAV